MLADRRVSSNETVRSLAPAGTALFTRCEDAGRAWIAPSDAVLLRTIGEADPAMRVPMADEPDDRLTCIRRDLGGSMVGSPDRRQASCGVGVKPAANVPGAPTEGSGPHRSLWC